MFGQIFKFALNTTKNIKNFQRQISSTKSCLVKFEVKINQQNETFELHDTEVNSLDSEKQKKFEFPFVYLRDNCRVSLLHHLLSSHHHHTQVCQFTLGRYE
jgi:hypothetical protein